MKANSNDSGVQAKNAAATEDASGPAAPSGPSPPREASQQEVFQAAIKESLQTGTFQDTRFFAFSQRTTVGTVSNIRPVFANGLMLKATSSHFDQREWFSMAFMILTRSLIHDLRTLLVLSGKFDESSASIIDTDGLLDEYISTESYEYWSDSDLEDEVAESNESESAAAPSSSAQSAESDDVKPIVDPIPEVKEETTSGTSHSKFSAAESEWVRHLVDTDIQACDFFFQDFEEAGPAEESLPAEEALAAEEPNDTKMKAQPQRTVSGGNLGRTIFIKDMAFTTYVLVDACPLTLLTFQTAGRLSCSMFTLVAYGLHHCALREQWLKAITHRGPSAVSQTHVHPSRFIDLQIR